MRSIGYLAYLRIARRDCESWFDSVPLCYSPAATLF
jgi:hypothetical protein